MTNLLIIALLVVFAIMAGVALRDAMFGVLGLCGKIARVIDRSPNRIIIPTCLLVGPLLLLIAVYFSH